MSGCDMSFLDTVGDGGWDIYSGIHQHAKFAGLLTEETDQFDFHFLRHFRSGDDIGRIAGGGDANEDIARLAQSFHLPGENTVETEVVGAGGHGGCVGGQSDCRERPPFPFSAEPDCEFGGEVLAVSGGTAVAAEHDFIACLYSSGDETARSENRIQAFLLHGNFDFGGFAKFIYCQALQSVFRWINHAAYSGILKSRQR